MRMTRERWGLAVAWTPIVVTLATLLGVFINANLGWPNSMIVGVAPFVVSLGGWYAIFMVFMWAFRWPRCELLPRAFIALGWSVLLILLVAGTAVVFLGIPPIMKDVLYDPPFRIVRACDVNMRSMEMWRCDLRQRPPGHGEGFLWAGFLDDGRVAAGIGVWGPPRQVQGGTHEYRTAALLAPDGGLDRAFADKFHTCVGSSEKTVQWRFLPVGQRIVYAQTDPDRRRFIIRAVIEEDGTALDLDATRQYGRALESFGATELSLTYDERGKAFLLAIGDEPSGMSSTQRAALFDPEGPETKLIRVFPGLIPGNRRLPFETDIPLVIRGEDLLAPMWLCRDPSQPDEANQPGICILKSEGPKREPLGTLVIPSEPPFSSSAVESITPLAALPGGIAVCLRLKGTNGNKGTVFSILGENQTVLPHVAFQSHLACGQARPLGNGSLAILSNFGGGE